MSRFQKLLSYERYGVEVFLQFVSLIESRRGGWLKAVFVAVEIWTVGSRPPAAVIVRISKNGRYDLGTAAPSSTKTSSLQGLWPLCRNWSSWSSVRVQPGLQSSYPHASLELQ